MPLAADGDPPGTWLFLRRSRRSVFRDGRVVPAATFVPRPDPQYLESLSRRATVDPGGAPAIPTHRSVARRYGRAQSAMADGMRLGADGLLAEDGMHRMAVAPAEHGGTADSLPESNMDEAHRDREPDSTPTSTDEPSPDAQVMTRFPDESLGEPVLSADELRALLQEQPAPPPNSKENGNPS